MEYNCGISRYNHRGEREEVITESGIITRNTPGEPNVPTGGWIKINVGWGWLKFTTSEWLTVEFEN